MGHKSFCRSVGFNPCWIGILLIIGACGPSDMRKAGERRFLIVLNFCNLTRSFNLGELEARAALRLSTHLDRAGEKLADELQLRGDEGVILDVF